MAPTRYELVASVVALQEITTGEPALAERRRALLGDLPLLEPSAESRRLTQQLLNLRRLPPSATVDAEHVAAATIGAVDYLVTWNLRHLAGAVVRRRREDALRQLGFDPPTRCTPEELLADTSDLGGPDV